MPSTILYIYICKNDKETYKNEIAIWVVAEPLDFPFPNFSLALLPRDHFSKTSVCLGRNSVLHVFKTMECFKVFCLFVKTSVARGVIYLPESSVNDFTCLKGGWQGIPSMLAVRHWFQSLALPWCWIESPERQPLSKTPLSSPEFPQAYPRLHRENLLPRESLSLGSQTSWLFWQPLVDPSPWIPPLSLETWFLHYSVLPKAAPTSHQIPGLPPPTATSHHTLLAKFPRPHSSTPLF